MKKNTPFVLYLILVFLVPCMAHGQGETDNYRIVPTSPQAQQFERMGNLAVNPASGLPSVQVPLYTLALKDFSWDIGLSYRAKGFKVDEVSSNVGLGWNLGLNGVISATVFQRSDVIMPLDDVQTVLKRDLDLTGYYSGSAVVYNNPTDVNHANQSLIALGSNHQPDIFSINIGNINYKMFIKDTVDAASQPIAMGYTMPASNLSIRFRRYLSGPGTLDSAAFEIKDARGNSYFLSARGSNITLDYCTGRKLTARDRNYVFYLDKIRTVNNEEIRFYYKATSSSYEYRNSRSYTSADRTNFDYPCNELNPDPYNSVCIPRFQSIEPLLDSVWTSNGNTVRLGYAQRLDVNNNLGADPNSVISSLKIYGKGQLLRSILFDQGYFGSGTDPEDLRLKLNKVSILDSNEDTGTKQEYIFQYDGTPLPNRQSLSQDSSGYYNQVINTTLIPSLSNRTSNLAGTKASVMERIYYPTGGYTEFTYALSKLPDRGLVVEQILDHDGSITTNQRNYVYKHPQGIWPDIWTKYEDVYFISNVGTGDQLVSCMLFYQYSSATDPFMNTQLNRSEPYFAQIEEFIGPSGINGRVDYSYGWQSQTIGVYHLPVELKEKLSYSKSPTTGSYILVQKEAFEYLAKFGPGGTYTDPMGTKEVRVFGKQFFKIHDEYTQYPAQYSQAPFSLRSIPYYQVKKETWAYDPVGGQEVYSSTQSHYDNDWHGLPSRTETSRSNQDLLVSFTSYPLDYASGTTFIDDMNAGNLISYPIEKVSYTQSPSNVVHITGGTISTYKSGGRGWIDEVLALQTTAPIASAGFKFSTAAMGAVPPLAISASYAADSRYATDFTMNNYDSRGNLRQYTFRSGLSTCYLWAYNQQYPIAEIRNADFATIESILGTGAISTMENSNPGKVDIDAFLAPLKIALPQAHILSFSYIPLVGIVSSTDAKGMSTYFEYDEFQRLRHVKNDNGDILKSNVYHLKN